AGVEIHGEQRLAEQPVARPVRAVVVAGRLLDREIDRLELLVDGDLRPDARIARVLGRAAQPALGAELAGLRDGVEDPEPLARAHVVAADEALHVARALRIRARPMRGADDHDVFRDDRRRVQADLAVQRVDVLVVVLLEIDDTVYAEALDALAR